MACNSMGIWGPLLASGSTYIHLKIHTYVYLKKKTGKLKMGQAETYFCQKADHQWGCICNEHRLKAWRKQYQVPHPPASIWNILTFNDSMATTCLHSDSYVLVKQSWLKFPESMLLHCEPATRAEANAGISQPPPSLCLSSQRLVVEPVLRIMFHFIDGKIETDRSQVS